MKIKYILFFYLIVLLSLFQLNSCKKENSYSTKNLSFSVDTLIFDTVFTTIGSTTKNFKMYNTDSKAMLIQEIQLMGGSSSPFRINVDGVPGILHQNVEINAKDSLFIFVEVTLNVNGQNLPMIVEDSIRFKVNNKIQYVKLAVWGQDAYFHYADFNEGTWPNDKPHVIYNYTAIDSAKTLTIQAGTKVHFHKNSILYVYKGSLQVEGALGNEVVFQGDRLEPYYQSIAGQWYGIYFQEARPSKINYAVIKNGTAGLHLTSNGPTNPSYTLEVTNTQILNHANYGIWLYDRARIKVENSIIAKNGSHALFVLQGGSYFINQCHLLGYGSGTQSTAVGLKNYFVQNGVATVSSIPEGLITNSVIYGNQLSELAFDTLNPDNAVQLNFQFRRNLIKLEVPSTHSMFSNVKWNENPGFTNVAENNYKFGANSPMKNMPGPNSNFLFLDIEGKSRSNPTDLGAFEIK
jgi:hypothetical protein